MSRSRTSRSSWIRGGTSTTTTRSKKPASWFSAISGMSSTTIAPGSAPCSSSRMRSPTSGWTIAFSFAAQLGVGEDDLAELLPVQGAVRGQHAGAEHADHLGQAGGARLDDLAGHLVGVDDQRAVAGQPPGHLALAGADPAGQADLKHAAADHSPGR